MTDDKRLGRASNAPPVFLGLMDKFVKAAAKGFSGAWTACSLPMSTFWYGVLWQFITLIEIVRDFLSLQKLKVLLTISLTLKMHQKLLRLFISVLDRKCNN